MRRRQFIKSVSAAGLSLPLSAHARSQAYTDIGDADLVLSSALRLPTQNQVWLGSELWANRLQDWRVNDGRLECLEGGATFEVRTVALLTRSLNDQANAGRVRCKLGTLNPGKKGFAGFLLGVGAGQLDYRGAALAQRAPGVNGGLMAVVDDTGDVSLIDFSAENSSLTFRPLKGKSGQSARVAAKAEQWMLECEFKPNASNRFSLILSVYDARTKQRLSSAVYHDIEPEYLVGGISLVSSPELGVEGSRWWFSDIQTSAGKVDTHEDRALSPVLGCLHSLDATDPTRAVLKMTAQLFPIADASKRRLAFKAYHADKQRWVEQARAGIEDGYVAIFKIDNWDAQHAWPYRVQFVDDDAVLYEGTIGVGSESTTPLSVALLSCILPTAKGLDLIDYKSSIPQEQPLGRYTGDNILFPHSELVTNCKKNSPDLYLFCGDQYYETYPTRPGRHTEDAKLDTLYRWYLWLWTFRDVLTDKPCIVLADDHDVLQGNLWGNAGLDAKDKKEESGGFTWDKDLVRMVYRIQHSHNPDSNADTTIRHGIPLSYGSFVYCGADFAFVEDRKFKTPPDYEANPLTVSGELLGRKQEAFLDAWGQVNRNMPKVCITASMWGSPQTAADGSPLLDYDANGYPPDGRTRAVKLAAKANALVLAGDQHLGMVARQGVDDFDDGALFFSGPAAAAFWQRWFEAEGKLSNSRNDDPNTGDFVDTFGNKMRVLAVANPKISHQEFDKSSEGWGKFVADHRLKSEGYGIVRIDQVNKQFVLECWPAKASPDTDQQFAGWPVIEPILDR